jgi:hypothetical protein
MEHNKREETMNARLCGAALARMMASAAEALLPIADSDTAEGLSSRLSKDD